MSIFTIDIIDPADGRPAWWDKALCNTGDGDFLSVFFSTEPANVAEAQRRCADCEVTGPCFEGAVARRETQGVWGGVEFSPSRVRRARRAFRLAAESEPEANPAA